MIEFIGTSFDPAMMARQLPEASGTWPELPEKIVEFYEPDEYLAVLGRKER